MLRSLKIIIVVAILSLSVVASTSSIYPAFIPDKVYGSNSGQCIWNLMISSQRSDGWLSHLNNSPEDLHPMRGREDDILEAMFGKEAVAEFVFCGTLDHNLGQLRLLNIVQRASIFDVFNHSKTVHLRIPGSVDVDGYTYAVSINNRPKDQVKDWRLSLLDLGGNCNVAVTFDGVKLPKNCAGLCQGAMTLTELVFKDVDASEVEDITHLAYYCPRLKKVDFSGLENLDKSIWDYKSILERSNMVFEIGVKQWMYQQTKASGCWL